LVESILKIKPILGIKDGEVIVINTQQTHQKALSTLIDQIVDECPKGDNAFLCIQHGSIFYQAQTLSKN